MIKGMFGGAVGWLMLGTYGLGGVSTAIAQGQHRVQSEVRDSVAPNTKSPGSIPSKSQSVRVSLDAKDMTVENALLNVLKRGGLRSMYDAEHPAFSSKITIKITDMPVMEAVALILKGTGMTAKLSPNSETVLIRAVPENKKEESRAGIISGRVIDSATGKEIMGVTVTVNGYKISAITDERGVFTLVDVPGGRQVINFKAVGFRSVSRTIDIQDGKQALPNVLMIATAAMLSEVVTTVTGQQKKLEIGNDITTIDVPDVMKQAPITSVTDLLEARVPGLTVMRTSGVPGAPSRIRLRGIGGGLLAGKSGAPTNDPIVIVDGIRIYAGQTGVDDQKMGGGKYPTPSPIDQIDPNSIEKIEVLRGPSAAAMYGSDAGDGVIVITTKKGVAGATRWDVSASRGTESMPGTYAAPGYYRFGHMPRGTFGTVQVLCPSIQALEEYFKCNPDSLVRFQALNEERLSTVGRGHNNRLSGTASGGAKDLTYSVTGSIANSLGLTKMPSLYQDLFYKLYDSAPSERMRRPNTFDSKSGQMSLSGVFGKGLTVTYSTSLSQSKQTQSSANDQLAQLSSVYIDTSNIDPGMPGKYAYQLNTKNNSSLHSLALNLLKWDWLPISATVGIDKLERASEGLTPRGIIRAEEEIWSGGYLTVRSFLSKGGYTERREDINTNTARIIGNIFPGSRVSVTVGSEVTQRSNTGTEGRTDTLVDGISRPTNLDVASRSGRTSSTGGWFIEPRLNMNSRFFVNPGFRFDGGGGSGSRSGYRGGLWSLFPKLNFSWIAVDREGREPLWGVISMVRPRLAFGVAGVQPAAEWSLRTLEQHAGEEFGGGDSSFSDFGIRLRSVGNTRLGPERTQEIEGGFDIQLWETRLALSATGFYKMRKNAIQELPLAPSVGAFGRVNYEAEGSDDLSFVGSLSYYSNIGHVRNTGLELTLNALLLDLPNIGWNIDVSLSKYSNKLTELFGEQKTVDFGNGTRLVEGYPLFGRWSRPLSGWTIPTDGKKLWYGDFRIADSTVYMGMQAPDFEMPFRTSFTLLRGLISINGQFNYKAGLTQNNLGSGAHLGNIYNNPNSTYAEQAYALAAACYAYNRLSGGSGINGCNATDYGFIQKINSLRFNSMSVGYNVPRDYLRKLPVSSVSLSLQGSNLGLWTNYRGKDPDVNGNLVGDVTQDSGQLPMPRSWSLLIRIGT